MDKNASEEYIVLSNGKTLLANCGVIGISANDPHAIYEGYDGIVDYYDYLENSWRLAPEESAELADRMITLWTRWKEFKIEQAKTKEKEA